jgi:hypothetical protein
MVRTNAPVDEATIPALLQECSSQIAKLLSKPESYVMTLFDRVACMTMGGKTGPTCLVEVRSVGKLTPHQTRQLSETLCSLLSKRLDVPSARIFLNFMDFPGALWGHDGGVFG